MIHKGKVAAMTRLAIEEKNNPRQTFIIDHYWFDDYFSTEIWKDFFAVAAAYAAAVLLILVAYGDSWTVTYHIADVIALAKRLLIGFAVTEVLGILAGLYSHVKLYRDAYRKKIRMEKYLRRLNRMYDAEEQLRNAHG